MVSVRRVAPVLLLMVTIPLVAADKAKSKKSQSSSRPPRELHLVGDHWTPYLPPDPATYPPNARTHAIKQGETLSGIAQQEYQRVPLAADLGERTPGSPTRTGSIPATSSFCRAKRLPLQSAPRQRRQPRKPQRARGRLVGTQRWTVDDRKRRGLAGAGRPAPWPDHRRRGASRAGACAARSGSRRLLLRLHRRSEGADAELHRSVRRRRDDVQAGRPRSGRKRFRGRLVVRRRRNVDGTGRRRHVHDHRRRRHDHASAHG